MINSFFSGLEWWNTLLLTNYLDELQQILTDITNLSQPDSMEFRILYKDLNRLIGTVHVELIQLDRIMTVMQNNFPAPVKLTKMYEELTTILVEVIPFTSFNSCGIFRLSSTLPLTKQQQK